jgi:hypothetical protein
MPAQPTLSATGPSQACRVSRRRLQNAEEGEGGWVVGLGSPHARSTPEPRPRRRRFLCVDLTDLFCPRPPPWVLLPAGYMFAVLKKNTLGSQNWRRERISGHVPIERKHSNSGTKVQVYCL